MPQVDSGPSGLNSILESTYSSARSQGKDKGTASAIAWSAAKNKYKKHGDKWVSKFYGDLGILVLALNKVVNKSNSADYDYLSYPLQKLIESINKQDDIEHLSIADTLVNPYNREVDRDKVESIKNYIKETGKVKPVVYSEVDKDGTPANMITDGHHRFIALKELGHSTIPAKLSDENGIKTTAEELAVEVKKEIGSVDVQGLELVRQSLQGKTKRPHRRINEDSTITKGGPGSGCTAESGNCGRPSTGVSNEQLPPHLQSVIDRQRGFGIQDVTPEGYGPDKPADYSNSRKEALDSANKYAKTVNLPEIKTSNPVKVNPENGKRLAQAYENMPNSPDDPNVKSAYKALGNEVENQYKNLPVKIEFTPDDPYKSSKDMFDDVHQNKRLKVYTGGTEHPLLGQKDANGISLNDKFRAVHDYYGHAMFGHQFGPNGEENAWTEHSKMFSPEAQKALTTETRGQNSWYNFSAKNEGKAPHDREFAEQKVGILPDEFLPESARTKKFESVITFSKGGSGSGCNPAVGECGRPSTNKINDKAILLFGTTDNFKESAFINLDGEGLDAYKDEYEDHEVIARKIVPKAENNQDALVRVLQAGFIRNKTSGDSVNIEIMTRPTEKQMTTIQNAMLDRKAIYVDISTPDKEGGIASERFSGFKDFNSFINRHFPQKFEKGGPGSGRHPENPEGHSDNLDEQITQHKTDLKSGKINLKTFKQRVEPLYALKQRTESFSGQTLRPLNIPTGINKGGPGSGCNGPNCGRPSSGNKAWQEPIHSGNHIKEFLKNNNVVIATTDKSGLSSEKNTIRNEELEKYLIDKDIPYKKGNSSFGEWGKETAYIISAPTPEDSDKLKSMFFKQYKQDAILTIRNGHAVGVYQDGRILHGNVDKLSAGEDITDNYFEVDRQKFRLDLK